jgi:hypothetical protein
MIYVVIITLKFILALHIRKSMRKADGREIGQNGKPVVMHLEGNQDASKCNHLKEDRKVSETDVGSHFKLIAGLIALTFLQLSIGIAGCRTHVQKVPIVLPSSWPVVEISAPPGSWRAPLFASAIEKKKVYTIEQAISNEGKPSEGKYWAVGFNTDWSKEKVLEYYDTLLRPLGYLLHNKSDNVHMYVSDDGWTRIVIGYSPSYYWSLKITALSNEPSYEALQRARIMPENE